MKLEDLQTFTHRFGLQYKELFDNGYGISVIPEQKSAEVRLYEVGVLTHNEGRHSHLTCDTDITADVIRFCTVDDVNTLIERIRSLPKTE
jgi:hypothetical protein